MRTRGFDILLTALAPAIWGSTYVVTTQLLPGFPPVTVAMLRALPAGLLLLIVVRRLPEGVWWLRAFLLGALNFSIFWGMLFVSAYRLPGGVAATVGGIQPLLVVFLAAVLLSRPIRPLSIVAALVGIAGVALLVLTPNAKLDPIGVGAGFFGAASMAVGTVLARKWRPPVSLLTFTAWQLTAGGLLLTPLALFLEPSIHVPDAGNLLGLAWLGVIGAVLTYLLWFRGVARLESAVVSSLVFLSPVTAVLLGWLCLKQTLTWPQLAGVGFIFTSIWLSTVAEARPLRAAADRKSRRSEIDEAA